MKLLIGIVIVISGLYAFCLELALRRALQKVQANQSLSFWERWALRNHIRFMEKICVSL